MNARRIVFFIFFLSGVAGLVYEVSWTRQIGLLFGQTVQSASIVLACYFLGMAIGYLWAGHWVRRIRPLVGYAVCEIIVALWATLMPSLLDLAVRPQIASYLNNDNAAVQLAIRAALSCVLLLPATIALGATLPFIVGFFASVPALSKSSITVAYGLNVGGAFVGVLVATFFGISYFGVAGTSVAAAGLSIACAIAALAIDRKTRKEVQSSKFTPSVTKTNGRQSHLLERVSWKWHCAAAVSGFGILALQVLYVRMFSLVLHNSVYSFGMVVAIFLVALSVGAAITGKVGVRIESERGIFTAFQCGGTAITASMLLFLLWTKLEYFESGTSFSSYLLGIAGLSTAVVFVPVVILGLVLPWIWSSVNPKDTAGSVGLLTAINTVAASLGSLTASFILLPMIGLWGSFVILSILFLIASLLMFPAHRTKSNIAVTGGAIGFCLFAYMVSDQFRGENDDEHIVRRWESAYGWVDVVEFKETKGLQLRQNIHYGLGSTSSGTMERRQAHIPLLLHPAPKDVLFVGLATGITAGGALAHPTVTSIDVVELIPDVVKGAALFKDFNHDVVSDPKVNIFINDGRHFLQAEGKKYDVIVADLFVPWESHTGYLYTVENYLAAKRRLMPGGIYCQWIPLWQLGEVELRLIADSFSKVFPNTTLWFGKIHENWTIMGLIGSEGPVVIDFDSVNSRLLDSSFKNGRDRSWFKSADELLNTYAADWVVKEGAALNTDEHPRVEFSTPITAWTKGARLRFAGLRAFFDNVVTKLPHNGVAVINTPADAPPLSAEKRIELQRNLLRDVSP